MANTRVQLYSIDIYVMQISKTCPHVLEAYKIVFANYLYNSYLKYESIWSKHILIYLRILNLSIKIFTGPSGLRKCLHLPLGNFHEGKE